MKAAGKLFLCGVAALAFGGCVERKITIGSNPSGALVTVNNHEMGHTPVTFPFTWYGDYDVVIRAEKNVGTPEKPVMQRYYLHTHQKADIPPFEIIPMDLFAEVLPIPFKDEKLWAFNVPPVEEVPDDILIERAKALKGELDQPEKIQQEEQEKKKKK